MKIEIKELSTKGLSSLTISHKGQSFDLDAGSYTSAAIINREVLFKETNEYLATLSEEANDKLWELYVHVSDLLAPTEVVSPFMAKGEISKVADVVKKIYQIVTYKSLRGYVDRANLSIPPDVSEKFEEFNGWNRNYRSRTYIREDYVDMVALALGLRFMIPIWGLHIRILAATYGNQFKESEAVKLIELAGLHQWPPYKRMVEYIDDSVDKGVSMTMAFAGLSSEEIPRHLMAMALVRKISVGPLNTNVERESLARILFNYVTGTQQRMDGRFRSVTGIVQAKRKRALDKGDEDNSSVWDDYGQSTDVTEGDRQVLEVYSEKVEQIVKKLAPDLPMSRVHQCIANASRHDSRTIEPFQKAMIFWVIRDISPEAKGLLQKLTLLRLIGVVQAVLDYWGMFDLALLIGAEEYVDDDEMLFLPSEPRNKLTRQQIEILDQQYPYYRQETRRHDPSKRSNVAIIAIDEVVDMMSGIPWKVHAPRDIIERNPLLVESGYTYIPGDIRRQLADMIIKVNILNGSKVADKA